MRSAIQAMTRQRGVAGIDALVASVAPAHASVARRSLTVSHASPPLSAPSASTSAASAASTAAVAGSSSAATATAAASASPLSGLGVAGGSVRPARSTRLSGRPLPSLRHFVLRGQVLSMYRRVLRMSRRCPSAEQRTETVAHARSEIEAMRGASEPAHIKALLQEAKHKIDRLETMINLTR